MNGDGQRRSNVKGKVYKRPVSALMIIYIQDTKRVLMLQRRSDPDFWRSVTGSVGEGKATPQTAMCEVKEEATTGVVAGQPTLIDCQHTVEFEIFSHLRHRYAPGVTHNTESWFCLTLPHKRQIVFIEHLTYKWLDAPTTAALTKSWSSRQAIGQLVVNAAWTDRAI